MEPLSHACLFVVPHLRDAYVAIFAETFRPAYTEYARQRLQLIAEPRTRPAHVHEFRITPFSLAAALAAGLEPEDITEFLAECAYPFDAPPAARRAPKPAAAGSKKQKPPPATGLEAVGAFVTACMRSYHRARIIFDGSRGGGGRVLVACRSLRVARRLLRDPIIRGQARDDVVIEELRHGDDERTVSAVDNVAFGAVAVKREPQPDAAIDCDDEGSEKIEDDDDDEEEEEEEIDWASFTAAAQFELRDVAAAKFVAQRCVALGVPVHQLYDFCADRTVRDANIVLKAQTRPRPYQMAAAEAAVGGGAVRSGVLLLPCGAGKTLLGIMLLCAVRKRSLIVCASSVSVEQWRNQILEFADVQPPDSSNDSAAAAAGAVVVTAAKKAPAIGAARIACITGKTKDAVTDDTDIVITTYSMVAAARRQAQRLQARRERDDNEAVAAAPPATTAAAAPPASGRGKKPPTAAAAAPKLKPHEALFGREPWGLLLLDEVHVVPADVFSGALAPIRARSTIGLTATFVREDRRIDDVFHLVGPKLFDIAAEELCEQGFLARVTCVEVHVSMTRVFGAEFRQRTAVTDAARAATASTRVKREAAVGNNPTMNTSHHLLALLAAANPNKMLCTYELVARHVRDGAKVLVFCDHISLLKEYARLLGCPCVHGETSHRDRMIIFSDFQCTRSLNVICISRVGDVSVNLPCASVVVQVSSHGGSRRQEAQRLGRILRPKGDSSGGGGGVTEAWFYTIVSDDTGEGAYAARRTEFLVDQGYNCRIMRYLPPHEQHAAAADAVAAASASASTTAVGSGSGGGGATMLFVGDVASVKREQLFSVARATGIITAGAAGAAKLEPQVTVSAGRAVKRENATTTTAAATAAENAPAAVPLLVELGTVEWQARFLARLVANWELQFAAQSRVAAAAAAASKKKGGAATAARKRERDGGEDGTDVESGDGSYSSSSDSDDDGAVKREGRRRGALADVKQQWLAQAAAAATAAATSAPAARALDRFTVEGDVVYHEL